MELPLRRHRAHRSFADHRQLQEGRLFRVLVQRLTQFGSVGASVSHRGNRCREAAFLRIKHLEGLGNGNAFDPGVRVAGLGLPDHWSMGGRCSTVRKSCVKTTAREPRLPNDVLYKWSYPPWPSRSPNQGASGGNPSRRLRDSNPPPSLSPHTRPEAVIAPRPMSGIGIEMSEVARVDCLS